jgi:hypothetical protein
MSTTPDQPETPETPATGPFTAAPHAKDTSADPLDTGAKAPNSLLTRPTDHAAKPGFRSAPNKNSKAQKRKK